MQDSVKDIVPLTDVDIDMNFVMEMAVDKPDMETACPPQNDSGQNDNIKSGDIPAEEEGLQKEEALGQEESLQEAEGSKVTGGSAPNEELQKEEADSKGDIEKRLDIRKLFSSRKRKIGLAGVMGVAIALPIFFFIRKGFFHTEKSVETLAGIFQAGINPAGNLEMDFRIPEAGEKEQTTSESNEAGFRESGIAEEPPVSFGKGDTDSGEPETSEKPSSDSMQAEDPAETEESGQQENDNSAFLNPKDVCGMRNCSQLEPVLQNPELPNGCEVAALATVLKYEGFSVTAVELDQKYLPKQNFTYSADGTRFGPDPEKYYVGEPSSLRGGGIASKDLWLRRQKPILRTREVTLV